MALQHWQQPRSQPQSQPQSQPRNQHHNQLLLQHLHLTIYAPASPRKRSAKSLDVNGRRKFVWKHRRVLVTTNPLKLLAMAFKGVAGETKYVKQRYLANRVKSFSLKSEPARRRGVYLSWKQMSARDDGTRHNNPLSFRIWVCKIIQSFI